MVDKYNNILIATDGSENSKNAIQSGINLASKTGAKVYAVYVIHPVSVTTGRKGPDWVEAAREMMRDEGEKATNYIKKMGDEENLEVESVILEGDPGDEIVKFADKNDVDLIVMGTRGLSGIQRFMVGSVADKVVKHSNTEVLIVPS
ncbi:UspA domain protein [Methanohalobium evestigatum Z-7303]|uniref:UspA domain protein n=1 Tax=Methanohalobium evestigatum (strain ATCC BAA-1072 / DSM 3721 / NBRC 107634 / OCM 161 / Z-7303) TaxID=644295 RepID=D7E6K6_METEZ|nr:universal stress protein [Methanohalobium evestigatum]ADI73228.1 UspA domain protein [Methanohalobium evestigatum Z-7303]